MRHNGRTRAPGAVCLPGGGVLGQSQEIWKSLNLAILKIIHWERLKLMPLGDKEIKVKFGFERLLTIFFTLAACCCPRLFCPRPPGDLCDCDNRQFMDSHLILIQRLLEHQPKRKHRKIAPFFGTSRMCFLADVLTDKCHLGVQI